ncbi:LPXTG-motif cell wall anchor domain protein, partial [Durusdinium trenchii]
RPPGLDGPKATPAARRKTQGPLMPPLPPSALKPDCPVSAPEAVGGWPEAEPPTTAAAEAPAAAPAATAAEAPTPAAAPADVPEMPPLSTSAPRVDPRKQSAQLAAPPTMQPIMQPAAQPAAQPTIQSPAAAQPSLPLPGRQEVSRKTATQLRSELNRLREAMERQNSTESSGKSSDMNALKEELMKLQKQPRAQPRD